ATFCESPRPDSHAVNSNAIANPNASNERDMFSSMAFLDSQLSSCGSDSAWCPSKARPRSGPDPRQLDLSHGNNVPDTLQTGARLDGPQLGGTTFTATRLLR